MISNNYDDRWNRIFLFTLYSFNEEHAISYKRLMSRVFANGLGDRNSIPGQAIPKTQKMVLDSALLNTQHYKVRI